MNMYSSENKKRVLILGKNNIAIECCDIVLKNKNFEVVACVPNSNDSGKDGWQKSFIKYSKEKNLNILNIKNIKSVSSIKELYDLNLDFIFSFQFDQIISQKVIDIPNNGAINLHFSPLPKYRGVSPIAWALINGEKTYGVTLHCMDPGVDTGDIISQSTFNIESLNNARELYEACEKSGINLFNQTLDQLISMNLATKAQNNSEAIYYSKGSINFKKSEINFNQSTYMLYNWIRAFIFPPFQYPFFKLNKSLKYVTSAKPIYKKNNFEKPGTVIKKSENDLLIATQDSYIALTIQ